jgi:hypothetical protein
MALELASITIYPVKSCAGLVQQRARVEPRGLAHDRRWMVVDPGGRFLTGRQLPRLTLLRAHTDGQTLWLDAPGLPGLRIETPRPGGERLRVGVWKDAVDAACAGAQADAWLGEMLGQPVRLVHMDEAALRPIDAAYAVPGDQVSFADGFPLLLIGQASLDALNERLSLPVPMIRFRPNLVVRGAAAHAEDGWRRIRVDGVPFDVVKPCTRCVFTTVDPETGTFDAAREPLRTLGTYRRTAQGITFGQNLIARGLGELRAGARIEVESA